MKRNAGVRLLVVALMGASTGDLLWAQRPGHRIGRTAVTVVYEFTPAYGPSFHEIEYYRADGSFAKAVLQAGDTQVPQVAVIDVAAKREFLKDPLTNLYDEVSLTQRGYDAYRYSPTTCEALIVIKQQQVCAPLGDDRVLGYQVQKITTTIPPKITTTIKRSGQVAEEWVAPDLNFLQLRRVIRENGKVVMSRQPISVQVGEPDENAFALPSHFKKVANASEWITAGNVARGRPDTFDERTRQAFDEAQRDKRNQAKSSVVRE